VRVAAIVQLSDQKMPANCYASGGISGPRSIRDAQGEVMLVLSRSIGESVVIGEGTVTVTVLKVIGNQVRIGITAPREVAVDREEVHERRRREQPTDAHTV
jgi:carbon storage regulator